MSSSEVKDCINLELITVLFTCVRIEQEASRVLYHAFLYFWVWEYVLNHYNAHVWLIWIVMIKIKWKLNLTRILKSGKSCKLCCAVRQPPPPLSIYDACRQWIHQQRVWDGYSWFWHWLSFPGFCVCQLKWSLQVRILPIKYDQKQVGVGPSCFDFSPVLCIQAQLNRWSHEFN